MLPDATPSTFSDPTVYRRELVRNTFARRIKWRIEWLGFNLMEALLGLPPLPWVAWAGRMAGAVAGLVMARRRRAVSRNLRIAFADEKSPAEIGQMTSEVFRRSGANLLCSLRTKSMGEAALADALVVRDEAIFRDALARGKGIIAVMGHMGNWEALAQWFPQVVPKGVSVAGIFRPLNNPLMHLKIVEMRRRRGLNLFSKDDNPLAMAAFLRAGGVLSFMSDQRAGSTGELVPFFGRTTSCTPMPAILARRTGATLVGVSLRTIGVGRWELGFHAADEGEATTAGVMRLLERVIRQSPTDVFWLQDRWKIGNRPHICPGKKPRHGEVGGSKRRRALVWFEGRGMPPIPPAPSPDDVDYELALAANAASAEATTGTSWCEVHRHRGETLEVFLRQIDERHGQPLEYVVADASAPAALRRACSKLGLGWVRVEKVV